MTTLAGFKGTFVHEQRLAPTEQEIWDCAYQSGITAAMQDPDIALKATQMMAEIIKTQAKRIKEIEVSQPPQEPDIRRQELVLLVGKLIRALRKAAPDHALPDQVLDYLRRNGLQPSPLREAK